MISSPPRALPTKFYLYFWLVRQLHSQAHRIWIAFREQRKDQHKQLLLYRKQDNMSWVYFRRLLLHFGILWKRQTDFGIGGAYLKKKIALREHARGALTEGSSQWDDGLTPSRGVRCLAAVVRAVKLR